LIAVNESINWQKDRVESYFDGKLIQSCTGLAHADWLPLPAAQSGSEGDWAGYPDSTVSPAELRITA
jgi:hypothetical protein